MDSDDDSSNDQRATATTSAGTKRKASTAAASKTRKDNNDNADNDEQQDDRQSSSNADSVVDESKRIIDVSKASNRVWLAKLPSFLMKHWMEQPERAELGTVRVETTAEGGTKVTLQLPPNDPLPKNYSLQFTSTPPGNMLVFTEGEEPGTARALEGSIQHECNVQPVMDESYRNVMRARKIGIRTEGRDLYSGHLLFSGLVEAERPKRTTQLAEITGTSHMIRMEETFSLGQKEAFQLMPKKRRNEDFRRDRLPREEVLELIFKAYELHEYWSLKGLVEHTHQPVAYLKEILQDVCVYLSRGPYKSLYHLKPEYKATQRSSAAATPAQQAPPSRPAPNRASAEADSDDEDEEEL